MQTKTKPRKQELKPSAGRGGTRPGSGRPPKADKDLWVEANVRLRRDTVQRLRDGAGSKLFGKFLQEHLDRNPPPTREEYLRLATRRVRVPLSPEEREAREWARLSPGERMQLSLFKNPKRMNDPAFVARLKAKRDKEEAKLVVPMEGDLWHVILCDRTGWRRLSVSNAQTKELPGWTVMNRLKDAFFSDTDWVVQFYPPKDVESPAGCLELWQPLNDPLPLPIDGRDQTIGTDQRVHVETRPGGGTPPLCPGPSPSVDAASR